MKSTRRIVQVSASTLMALMVASCGLLDVTDPTVLEESDLGNPRGAQLLRQEALAQYYNAAGQGARFGGLMSDEYFGELDDTRRSFLAPWNEELADQRSSLALEERFTAGGFPYQHLQEARITATHAERFLTQYGAPSSREAAIGEMLAVRGYATMSLAEQVCPGFALHRLVEGRPEFGTPVTAMQAYEDALADLASARDFATDSARILNIARVGSARALLELGRFTDAAAAAAQVPTTFEWNALFGTSGTTNALWHTRSPFRNIGVADNEAGTGIDFVSAADPRLPLMVLGLTIDRSADLYAPTKYSTRNSPLVLASGIEARLIEAEAALNDGDPSWLAILNDLRANHVTPALPPLVAAGSFDANVDLLFRERAFWLFGTGRRLGDMRRLVRAYDRPAESVFPSGEYRTGDNYEDATAIPFGIRGEDQTGSGVTGCTTR